MDLQRAAVLEEVAHRHGTPCYVYFADEIDQRLQALRAAFDGRFAVSFAVKSNPNSELLRHLAGRIDRFDVSSGGELSRVLGIGFDGARISFSGPAKRNAELVAALDAGCGEIVCESDQEADALDRLAGERGRTLDILVRINPARMPRRFGINMAGKPSQFGIDEEQISGFLERCKRRRFLRVRGFHIYSGTNCLDADAIVENFAIFIDLFRRFVVDASMARTLIFGSGFGIPYFDGEQAFDLSGLAERINVQLDALRAEERFHASSLVLEMGRWVVGPCGYLLTQVIGEKRSRGVDIRLCDAGFNHHLNAAGMMGAVIRRNWPFSNLSATKRSAPICSYMLTGPLCTTADVFASQIELPETRTGDILAVGASGAYGPSASPLGFISHPLPREVLVFSSGESVDITERGLPVETSA